MCLKSPLEASEKVEGTSPECQEASNGQATPVPSRSPGGGKGEQEEMVGVERREPGAWTSGFGGALSRRTASHQDQITNNL